MKNNIDRRLELSRMLLDMGQALIKEGEEKKDFCIRQSGSFLNVISSLMLDEKETYAFGELCSMFSAKIILDKLDESQRPNIPTYDEIIEQIKKMKNDNTEGPKE